MANMVCPLERKETQHLLKEQLGWENPSVCQEGFWLNKNTFLMSDDIEVVKIKRQKLDGEINTAPLPLMVLIGVAEMTVDKDNKIIGVENREKLGLWVDAVVRGLAPH